MTIDRRMVITFDMNNAAFDSVGLCIETARVLRDLANRLELGIAGVTKIFDENGNQIGQAEFYEDYLEGDRLNHLEARL